jgi:flavin reductase (DIM6/NTAB) family NADH-FMN oxidoreductase RutF
MAASGQVCSLDKKPLIEPRVFFLVSAGMYLISTKSGNKYNSAIASSLIQVSSSPPKMIVSIHKESLTHEYIQESKLFGVSVLSADTPKKFIMLLGFRSGKTHEKFKDLNYKIGKSGAPIALDHTIAYLDCQVEESLDCETHTVFAAKVIDAELISTEKPMTYIHYCEVLKGKTPTTSPLFACGC